MPVAHKHRFLASWVKEVGLYFITGLGKSAPCNRPDTQFRQKLPEVILHRLFKQVQYAGRYYGKGKWRGTRKVGRGLPVSLNSFSGV